MTITRYKRISELPEAKAEGVEMLGLNSAGANVRVPYDIKQVTGTSTTSLMSQAAITAELAKRDAAIKDKKGTTIVIGRSIKYGSSDVAADTTITDAIEILAERVENIALTEIPDGSITEVKLSEDVREKLNHDNGYWYEVIGEVALSTSNDTT